MASHNFCGLFRAFYFQQLLLAPYSTCILTNHGTGQRSQGTSCYISGQVADILSAPYNYLLLVKRSMKYPSFTLVVNLDIKMLQANIGPIIQNILLYFITIIIKFIQEQTLFQFRVSADVFTYIRHYVEYRNFNFIHIVKPLLSTLKL